MNNDADISICEFIFSVWMIICFSITSLIFIRVMEERIGYKQKELWMIHIEYFILYVYWFIVPIVFLFYSIWIYTQREKLRWRKNRWFKYACYATMLSLLNESRTSYKQRKKKKLRELSANIPR